MNNNTFIINSKWKNQKRDMINMYRNTKKNGNN